MTPVKEIDCPQPTRPQWIAFGILCVKQVYTDRKWNAWADAWLSGEDRSCAAAHAAAHAAYTAAHAAYDAAYGAASDTYAAYAAAYDILAYAASAAHTATHAASCSGTPDLVAIAKQAMTY